MAEAEKIPYHTAVDIMTLGNEDINKRLEQYIFVRFKNGYYENLPISNYPPNLATVMSIRKYISKPA